MRTLLSALMRSRRAASAVEYGMILSLIVLVMVVSLKLLAVQVVGTWDAIHNAVANAH